MEKPHRSNSDRPAGGLLPIIFQTQKPEDYDSADNYGENLIPHDCVDNDHNFDIFTSQINGVYDADADS